MAITIDSPKAIGELVSVLKTGKSHDDHECASTGSITFNYLLASKRIRILPGHDNARYEFRQFGRNYFVDRKTLFLAFENAGVDLKLIAKTPKDIPIVD